jgi:hypothetical protein
MSTRYIVLNNVRLPTGVVPAGTVVDDAFDDVPRLKGAAAVLVREDTAVGAIRLAGQRARDLRAEGGSEQEVQDVLLAGVLAALLGESAVAEVTALP